MKSCRTLAMRLMAGYFMVLAAVLLTSTSLALAQENPQPVPTAQVHTESIDAEPLHVDLALVPQLTSAQIGALREAPRPLNPHFTEAQLKNIKAQASIQPAVSRPQDAVDHAPSPPSMPEQAEIGPFTPGNFVNFAGASQGCNGLGWKPSDMGLAVSSTWVVQTVNECLSVFSKTGVLQTGFPKDYCSIWGLPPNSGTHGCYDPRAEFDFVANRFILSGGYQDSSGNAFILVAASVTSDPRGAYHAYVIPRGKGFADYPTLGQGWANDPHTSAIYVCDNFSGASFTAECIFVPKTKVYGGTALGTFYIASGFNLSGTLLDTLQPVNVYEPGTKPRTEFAINAINTNGGGVCGGKPCSGLVVWSFANTVFQTGTPGPSVSAIFTGFGSTSAYSYPANADDAGFCTNCVETIDNRITGMVYYSAGHLFATIDTANGGTSAVLGWDVRPFLDDNGGGCTGTFLNACPHITSATIEKEFCDYCGAGSFAAFFGSIAPTPENNWTMFANFSNTSTSPGTFYTSNRVTWPTPFHDAGTFACVNNANYTQGRWGDYTAAAPDIPGTSNSPAVWGSGMYVQPSGAWGTCIAANKFVKVTDP